MVGDISNMYDELDPEAAASAVKSALLKVPVWAKRRVLDRVNMTRGGNDVLAGAAVNDNRVVIEFEILLDMCIYDCNHTYYMSWLGNEICAFKIKITPPFRDFFRSESSINRSAAPPSAVCVHASHAALAPAFSSHSSSLHIVLKTRSLAGDQDQVHSPQHCSSLPHNPHIAGVCFTLVCIVRKRRNALKWSRLVGLIARCCTAEHDVGVFCRRWVGQVALPTTHNLVCGVLGRAVANSTLQGGRRP